MTSLVKKVDAETAKNSKVKMGSFVVFLTGDEKIPEKLKALGQKEGIKSTILSSMETPAGPEKYKVAKEADVTVILYRKQKVAANHAFKKGELNATAIDAIIADLPKILETKEEPKKEKDSK